MRGDFDQQLAIGRVGERLVAEFLRGRGCGVIPSYEFSGQSGDKAPRLIFANGGIVVPDLDTARQGDRRWIEVKTYTDAALYRRLGVRVHGVLRRHFDDYMAVESATGNAVYLAVLEIATGDLLVGRLCNLPSLPCLRWDCEQVPHRCQLYFPRDRFGLWHTFPADALLELRQLAGQQAVRA